MGKTGQHINTDLQRRSVNRKLNEFTGEYINLVIERKLVGERVPPYLTKNGYATQAAIDVIRTMLRHSAIEPARAIPEKQILDEVPGRGVMYYANVYDIVSFTDMCCRVKLKINTEPGSVFANVPVPVYRSLYYLNPEHPVVVREVEKFKQREEQLKMMYGNG